MAARQGTKIKDQRVLALDIGSRFIKAVELRMARGTISVLRVAVSPTPPDALDKSQILDPEGLGLEIRRLMTEHKITTRNVVISVRGQSSVVVRPIELPKMSLKELADTMKFEVERHIPFAVSEVVMDYAPFVDPAELPETDENMKVLLAVAQEELINAYLKLLKVAKLTPVALDVEILASIRALVDIQRDAGGYEGAVALINVGASTTDISIVKQGELAFNRSVPIAGDALTNAIVEQLGRTFEEAEELKKEQARLFLDAAVGELPVPGEAEILPTPAGNTSFFNAFGANGGSMDATVALDAKQTADAPKQVFSLDDDFTSATPPEPPSQPSPLATDDARPVFRFTDDEDEDEDTAPAFTLEEKPAAARPVFDLSSELEEQMPPPLARPTFTDEPEDAPAAVTAPDLSAAPMGEAIAAQSTSPDLLQSAPTNANAAVDAFQRRIFECIQPTLVELATEIRRSLEFYSTRESEHPVEKLLLFGGTSRLPQLAEFLYQEIGIEVVYANPLQLLDTAPCQLPEEYLKDLAPVLPVCIGLGLRDMLA